MSGGASKVVLGTSVLISRALCTFSHGRRALASVWLHKQKASLLLTRDQNVEGFFLKLHVSGVKLQLDKVTGRIFNAGREDDGAHTAQLLHRNSFLKELK